jgi:gamma-glutamylcyclotransferase (GGCT)/AIG2-like uncharacterized protein YtfP
LSRSEPRHIVFYGSLRAGLHLGGEPPFTPHVRLVGPCRLAGRLYEVAGGAYPTLELLDSEWSAAPDGAGLESTVVHGDLYELLDPAALGLLDRWEEYDPTRPDLSPYVRRAVRLLEPDLVAWVYAGQHRDRGPLVPGGDWRHHRRLSA